MKKHKIKPIDEYIYETELENGFKIFVVPDNKKSNTFCSLVVDFGSATLEFEVDGMKKKVPSGIAHFLEHQIFDGKEKQLKIYDKYSSHYNANTSYGRTAYLVDFDKNPEENIIALFDLVTSLKINKASVEKEKGIIYQEKKMVDDIPDSKLFHAIFKNLFVNDYHKISILGTEEDIFATTKEDLEECYNAFYKPDNMFLVVTGKTNPEEITSLVKKYYQTKQYKKSKVTKLFLEEPEKVDLKVEKITTKMETPRVSVAYKVPILKTYEVWKQKLFLLYVLIENFSTTSTILEELEDKDLIEGLIGFDAEIVNDYFEIDLQVQSKATRKVKKHLEDSLSLEISKEQFENSKKKIVAMYIRLFDNPEILNSAIISSIINYKNIENSLMNNITNPDYEEMTNYLKELDLRNKCVVYLDKSK